MAGSERGRRGRAESVCDPPASEYEQKTPATAAVGFATATRQAISRPYDAAARKIAGTSCKAPAMANGRCRLHGGQSTVLRTEGPPSGAVPSAANMVATPIRPSLNGARPLSHSVPDPGLTRKRASQVSAGSNSCDAKPTSPSSSAGPARWRLPQQEVELSTGSLFLSTSRDCADSRLYPASADLEPLAVTAGKCAGVGRRREASEEIHHSLLLRLCSS